jgi:FixJ family two-component response regulator
MSRPGPTPRDQGPDQKPVVLIVDDDLAVREALDALLRSVDLHVETFGSAQEFMSGNLPTAPSCLVLDVRMPGLSGLDLQEELVKEQVNIPIIFLTGHGDVPMAVRALRAGAVNFLMKPFREQDLLDAVLPALELARQQHQQEARRSDVHARFKGLTRREQEILRLVVTGLVNKQAAFELGVSEVTVKIHRSNMMRKMGARSVPQLVRMADDLGIRPTA